ncbi:4'-phosphopantetheinyl transferase superfamily protein [Soonwooa sp.]|uniref:4'-phosphopantetheinyl transferase superfamily protein n=1 Tax=Soonwooa sp. TaxID=1938592 RepID=UPI00289F0FBD|nr:4'-phosphopantetheinyl transferase superfamily protein [Soonwooa sp.]
MPLYRDFSDDKAQLLVWKYDEQEVLDMDTLLEKENYNKVKEYHPKKIKEVLMVRKMLKQILPNHKILYKDNGEPFLEPQDFSISISHSFPLAAIGISKSKIGLDLELKKEKIKLIRHKFILHENDFIDNNHEVDYLTSIWSVKEALYKIHHSKYWSLKKHYDIQAFQPTDDFTVKARVYDHNFEDYFQVKVRKIDDYYFSVVLE